MSCEALSIEFMKMLKGICVEDDIELIGKILKELKHEAKGTMGSDCDGLDK